jgi:hypothetical protein
LIAASYTIKVVCDHTHIASYRRWGVMSIGKRVGLLDHDGRDADLAGGLSSDPILSSLRRTLLIQIPTLSQSKGNFFHVG